MEDDLLLKHRRLGNTNALPPGPPGAEFDTLDFAVDIKNAPKKLVEREPNRRRRSPSYSPPPSTKRRSNTRGRRTPSPRRSRFYSPDRRRYDTGRSRRTPTERRRSPRRSGRDNRDRFRGRGRSDSRDSRSRSRSPTPRRSNRWSPKRKQPHSPPPPPPPTATSVATTNMSQLIPVQAAQSQYNVMASQIYGGGGPFNQYNVPPSQTNYVTQNEAYNMQTPAVAGSVQTGFNTSYPPPVVGWTVVNEHQYEPQPWIPDATQVQPLVATAVPPKIINAPAPAVETNQQSLNVLPDAAPGTVELSPAHDAVAQEAFQRDELRKQRVSCFKKVAALRTELNLLRDHRKDLCSNKGPLSPTSKGFLEENDKLQGTIMKKLNTIENVVEMLTGIIGDDGTVDRDLIDVREAEDGEKEIQRGEKKSSETTARINQAKSKRTQSSTSSDSTSSSTDTSSSGSGSSSSSDEDAENNGEESPHPGTKNNKNVASVKAVTTKLQPTKAIPSPPPPPSVQLNQVQLKHEKVMEEKKKYNYVFYDPEMHWCQTCDAFPKTARDYLNHLHSKEHMDRETIDTPWHSKMINDQYPFYDNASTKRTPIRGLTFFVPATAWYCQLCNVWMGDLHCASLHLKSQLHSHRYNIYLEKNPHYEVNWLADRQRVLNEKKSAPLPPQITSVSTTAVARNKSKKSKKDDDEKTAKKRKKKSSDKKDKKKKKKSSKKRKKVATTAAAATTSSSSSSGSDSEESEQTKLRKAIIVKELNNPNPAASIRVTMRKQEDAAKVDNEDPPPPPSMNVPSSSVNAGRLGKWTVTQEAIVAAPIASAGKVVEEESKNDDAIMQQWNAVQPVISESEKKLLEQLKGKLKSKARLSPVAVIPPTAAASNARHVLESVGKENQDSRPQRREIEKDIRRRSRSPAYRGGSPDGSGRRVGRSRSRTRSRSRGRFRRLRRSRSRSRGGWSGRRRGRSRSRSVRRSNRRRRYSRSYTRSCSRSRSGSRNRIEKPVVKHAEFRPRVPEKDKETVKKLTDSREKKDAKKSKNMINSATLNTTSGKKLPFIGKMPVLKKQTSAQPEGSDQRVEENITFAVEANNTMTSAFAMHSQQRAIAPTAAQIQMAMMEDVYGNAPPFHPDASGVMVDYDDLMPDPVQFVNLMGQAPPPPPPPTSGTVAAADAGDEADMLPPGIDEIESEEFVQKPLTAPLNNSPHKASLPKDLEEALNIIFPGEKKPGDENNSEEESRKVTTGQTQIIKDEPVMQAEDLVKEGIHMVSIEETSLAGGDDASQLSMNEPLNFAKRTTAVAKSPPPSDDGAKIVGASGAVVVHSQLQLQDANAADDVLSNTNPKLSNGNPDYKLDFKKNLETIEVPLTAAAEVPLPTDIPMPDSSIQLQLYELGDIPQPPNSPTESEKIRRQEELNDLAMLGIDADDMAAQCM